MVSTHSLDLDDPVFVEYRPSTASILILWVRGTVQIEIGTPNFNLDCALAVLVDQTT